MPNSFLPGAVLSGFLGACKTTVLNHILANSEGPRVAVCGIPLTAAFIDERLAARRSPGHDEVRHFEQFYGEAHPPTCAPLVRTGAQRLGMKTRKDSAHVANARHHPHRLPR